MKQQTVTSVMLVVIGRHNSV